MSEEMPAVIVSACLLGVACNHEGRSSSAASFPSAPAEALTALRSTHRLIPVCPEVAGGLPTPRPPAEKGADGRVLTADGTDVTDLYERGAAHAVALAQAVRAVGAVLKARSPSCGCRQIYDGTHSRTLVPGEGVTAAAMRGAGVPVCSEEDLAASGPLAWSPPGA
jgi:uncharacterized protein YbbK (DUF523 family)